MSKRLIAVCGATGQQGGSVVRALLEHGAYAIRGLTRDLTAPASRELADKGVELVYAYPADKESLLKAFKGAYAVGLRNDRLPHGTQRDRSWEKLG